MAFGNVAALYFPAAANAGASQWGTDVRKLLDAADATSDATTITNHGTGGSVTRTEDPYTTTTTDGVEANFGWAITPSDMNSVAGARRFFPAGDHVATVRMSSNTVIGVSGTLSMYVYRVGSAAGGRVRTLLGSGTASVALPGSSGEVTATCAATLAEVVFEADETVQYSFEFTLAGVAITGRTATFFTGTQTSVQSRVNTPTLGVLADTTGTVASAGSAAGVTGNVLGTAGVASGSGVGSGVGASWAATTGAAAGLVTVSGLGSSVAGSTGDASGAGAAVGVSSVVLGAVGTVNIGGGGGAPEDYSPNDGLKAIADVVRHHETGAVVVGATVNLVRDSDEFHAASTTSGAGGAYSFPRDTNDPNTYHVYVYYLDGATKIQGVSERGLAPA